MKTCSTCYHYVTTDHTSGSCFRYPPTRNPSGFAAQSPEVMATRRACGEHRPAESQAIFPSPSAPVTPPPATPVTAGTIALIKNPSKRSK